MKKSLLIILFLSFNSLFAQLEVKTNNREVVGEIAPMGQMSSIIEKDGENYILIYRDMEYQQIVEFKNFSFKSIDDFYNLLTKGLENKRKDTEEISLDGVDLIIDFERILGIGSLRIHHIKNGIKGVTPWYTFKQLNQLFGKI